MDAITLGVADSIADAISFALGFGTAVGAVLGFICFAIYDRWQDRREELALSSRRAPLRAQGNWK